jgi:hypothetical protein
MEERQTRQCATGTVMSPYRDNPHLERPHVIEAPLRGSISREPAVALPSSSTSTATGGAAAHKRGDRDTPLFPNGIGSGTPPFFSNIGNGRGRRDGTCADHDTPLFFPIGSGIRRCGGAQAWRPCCSSLLPQRHRQWRSSLLPQQGAPL